ncbi:MAG: LacI family transcriptional regulator [Gammaproteobacteria bacterium]|nr:LacI family transcriptional regulator [Gammaproteobacteria bacterium]
MKSTKTTSLDIAARAGVSQSTVSRALRDSPQVSAATRRQIQRIAKEMGYTVDRNASRLRAQTTSTLALLLCEDEPESHINPFFLSILSSVAHAAAGHGYDLLVTFQQLSENWVQDFQDAHRADGIMLLGIRDRESYDAQLIALAASGTPFVIWGLDYHVPGVSSYVTCQNEQSAREITTHLIRLGHRHFAFVGRTSAANPEFTHRYHGYLDALASHAIATDPGRHIAANSAEAEGYDAVEALLAGGGPLDAIVCASDLIAIGAMAALRDRGLDVPGDVAVVGYDDLPIAQYTRPALTTVRQDTELAGRKLVEHLIRLIAGQVVLPDELPVSLMIRQSCGA